MQFNSIRPFVRYAKDVYIPHTRIIPVNTYDHRLFYVVNGNAQFEVNGHIKEVSPGTVLYWMSGTPYVIRPEKDTVLHLISINFDFTQTNAGSIHYLPMTSPQEYVPENRMENIQFKDAPPMNEPIVLPDISVILPYLRAVVREFSVPKSFSNTLLSDLMQIILIHLYREASQRQQVSAVHNSSKAILDYIHKHFAEDLSNQILADKFGYHPNYISRLIAEQTGTPLHKYLLKLRIQEGLHMLQTTDLSINEIAHQIGFKSSSYFSQYFKQCTGHSPKRFRLK